MLTRSLVPMLGTLALEASLLCNVAFAGSHSGSLVVTATVEAGCQVSPLLSAANIAASRPTIKENSVSVSCSLPAPYQISVTSRRGLSTKRVQSLNLAKELDLWSVRSGSLDLSTAEPKSADTSAGGDSGTVTVMVIY